MASEPYPILAPFPALPPRAEDLPSDDGVPLETQRHRDQMNVLIDSLRFGLRDRDDWYVSGNMFVYFSLSQVEAFRLDPVAGEYVPLPREPGGDVPCPSLGLSLGVRPTAFGQTSVADLLRWIDASGQVLPTAPELAAREQARADQERVRADQEQARADQEHARAAAAEAEVARLRAEIEKRG